jgi:hypothetical protein
VAIGVGVTLGLLLVAVTAGAVWWIRKLNRKIGAVASESKEDVLRLSELSSFDKRMEFGNEGMKTEIGQGMERRVELDTFKYGRAVELP